MKLRSNALFALLACLIGVGKLSVLAQVAMVEIFTGKVDYGTTDKFIRPLLP